MIPGQMKKILVIEDDLVLRRTLRELLETNNYKIFSAEDGLEGVKLAKEIKPDLIICDIMMPRLSGIGVVNELKKDNIFAAVPFIFLTAKSELTDMRKGMEIGADDYITKPFKAETILKAISARLEKFDLIMNNERLLAGTNLPENIPLLSEEDRIFIDTKTRQHFIKIGDILFIKAQGEYSEVYLVNETKILIRKLMKQWEDQLPRKIFLRIHRSTIINLSRIEKIERWFKRSYLVKLKGSDEKFIVSQRYSSTW